MKHGLTSSARVAFPVVLLAAAAAAAAAGGARPQPRRVSAASPAVKLLRETPRGGASCGQTARATWQACRAVTRCDARRVDPDAVTALFDAIEERARAHARAQCGRGACAAPRTRNGDNHFACTGAARLCLTLTVEATCGPARERPTRTSPPEREPERVPPSRPERVSPREPDDDRARRPRERAGGLDARPRHDAQGDAFEPASGPTLSNTAAAPAVRARRLPPFLFPGRAEHLDSGEYWFWKAPDGHGNGTQKYAYDLTTARWDKASGKWSECVSGSDGKAKCQYCSQAAKNSDCLDYGEPIYAMAPGRVIRCWRNAPENPRPGESHPGRTSNPKRIGGGGNALVVEQADGTVALYAHMQPGSIPAALCPHSAELMDDAGDSSESDVPEDQQARVEAGQFLGRIGNSGASSNPHTHVHVQDGPSKSSNGVPLDFRGAMIADALEPADLDWSRLKGQTRPTETSVIWPDFSKGLKEIAYHGVRDEDYQDLFDHAAGSGYQLEWIDGFELRGGVRLNVVFRPRSAPWAAFHNLSGAQYQAEYDKRKRDGFRLRHVDAYTARGKVLYAAIFVKDGGPGVAAYHGRSAEEHQALFQEWSSKGWRARNVSVVSVNGKRVYAALYDKGGPDVRLKSALTPAQYQQEFDDNRRAGLHLAYVNAYTHQGQTHYSAIWTEQSGGSIVARHGLSGAEYQSQWENARSDGLLTRAVSGSENGGRASYVAFWQR